MKASIVAKIAIAASPEEVFRYFKHLKFHPLWNPHILSITPQTTIKAGLEYETSSVFLGIRVKALNRVLAAVEDSRFAAENTTGAVHYRADYRLKKTPEGTLVTCTTSVEIKSQAFAFTRPVLKLLAKRELQTDLDALKLAVEHKLARA